MVFSSRQISQGKIFSGHRPLTPSSVPLQPDFSCCCLSCSHLSEKIFAVFHPCVSLQAPYPKLSLFPLPPSFWHSHLPVSGHWCSLCFSSHSSAVSSFWPLCSVSPQILGVQPSGPVLSLSFQFPLLNLVPQKLLESDEVWGIYKLQNISNPIDKGQEIWSKTSGSRSTFSGFSLNLPTL